MIVCSPQLGLAPKSTLGGEVFDREILLGLAEKGIKVVVILPKNKPHDVGINNWKIIRLPFSHFPAILFNILALPYLFQAGSQKGFQILRLHQPQFIFIAAYIYKLFNKETKIVATYHQFKESNYSLFSRFFNNYWDHIICDSHAVKSKLADFYHIPNKKISVVHNGVPGFLKPTPKDQQIEKSLNLKGKTVLLFYGLFIHRKNPLFLLNVLKELNNEQPDVVLIFWGTGPLESEIKLKAQKLGLLDKIRIQKPVYGQQKNKIHNIADIFVHPSKDEGFALAPLEAMACAKPVIMTKGYSAAEAISDGVNGFLCKADDTNYWSRSLKELIKNPTLRKKMGQASYAKVKREFQWKLAAKIHFDVFKKLVND